MELDLRTLEFTLDSVIKFLFFGCWSYFGAKHLSRIILLDLLENIASLFILQMLFFV